MFSKVLSDQFAASFYQWRMEEARKEYNSNFSRLFNMNSYRTNLAIEAICRLPEREQPYVLPLAAKSYDRKALEIVGAQIAPEEQALLDLWKLEMQNPELRKSLDSEDKKLKKFNKKLLRNTIKQKFEQEMQSVSYTDLWFNTKLDEHWVLSTFIEIESEGYGYYYSHLIRWFGEHEHSGIRVGTPTINLPAWLGLYPTGWNFREEEDIQKQADRIVNLCQYFIEACKTLLTQLH